ncbi:MAG: ubiquitin-conjugating enzyme E2 [Methanobacteriota archaeon]
MAETLPGDLVLTRIRNEIALCRKTLRHPFDADQTATIPVTIDMTLVDAPGPDEVDGMIVDRALHKIRIVVTKDYPYQKPVVRWKTPIFHPNIMGPDDGGYVCTRLLDRWDFRSTLAQFVQALEVLLAAPNPDSPYDTDSCTRAAAYFRRHPYVPPGRGSDPGARTAGAGGIRIRGAEEDR